MSIFSASEYLRYTRHIQLPQVGATGQAKLKQSHVLIIGCGGLGAPVSLYLAAAGIGKITLVDGDTVEITNLQRQVSFSENDIGHSKAISTKNRLTSLNSDITVDAINDNLSTKNASKLISTADLVLDCTDNFSTRYLINDTCKLLNKAWIYASISQFSGQCALFTPLQSCFRCLYPEAPNTVADCNTAGVLGVLPGLLGIIQATETIKYLLKLEGSITNQLLLFEALDMQLQHISLTQNKHCPSCHPQHNNKEPKDNVKINHKLPNVAVSAKNLFSQVHHCSISAANFEQSIQDSNLQLIDVRSHEEHIAFNVGGTNIPLEKIESNQHNLDLSKPILLYCQSGIRSAQACDILNGMHYNANTLDGGLSELLKHIDTKAID